MRTQTSEQHVASLTSGVDHGAHRNCRSSGAQHDMPKAFEHQAILSTSLELSCPSRSFRARLAIGFSPSQPKPVESTIRRREPRDCYAHILTAPIATPQMLSAVGILLPNSPLAQNLETMCDRLSCVSPHADDNWHPAHTARNGASGRHRRDEHGNCLL